MLSTPDLSHHKIKATVLAAASILCQPSVMESFSIVIMESWLAKTPVLVNSGCAVTAEHAKESGGGFSFGSFAEFAEQVDLLLGNETVRTKMGERGLRVCEQKLRLADHHQTLHPVCRYLFLKTLP